VHPDLQNVSKASEDVPKSLTKTFDSLKSLKLFENPQPCDRARILSAAAAVFSTNCFEDVDKMCHLCLELLEESQGSEKVGALPLVVSINR
jgi:hypothetical protein